MDVLGTVWELLRGCLGLFLCPVCMVCLWPVLWLELERFMACVGGCLWPIFMACLRGCSRDYLRGCLGLFMWPILWPVLWLDLERFMV